MTTVLVADDNEMNREIARRQLERRGYRVILADNGDEAVRAATEHRPDIIMMDVQMPVVNGYEAARRLKADAETRNIPIVAVTGFGENVRRKALDAGCDALLPKPYEIGDFIALIERLVGETSLDGNTDSQSEVVS